MTARGMRVAAVLVVGIGLVGMAGRTVMAQALKAKAGQTVAAQIIPADQEDEFVKGAVSFKTPGLVQPKLTHQTDPKYTSFALHAKIQGDVKLEAIIGVDGRVEKARVKASLDPDLDAEALKALDTWEFEAGLLNGVPTRVLVEVDMTFRVR